MNLIGKEVKHIRFGTGTISAFDGQHISVLYGTEERPFTFPDAFDRFLSTDDQKLLQAIEEARELKKEQERIKEEEKKQAIEHKPSTSGRYEQLEYSENNLIGSRAQNITFGSDREKFLVIGYLAKPGRISSIEAEVPTDGRDKVFEGLFPGQIYRPIAVSQTAGGTVSKMGVQLRINLDDIENCPVALKNNLGTGNGGHAARVNKSQFVYSLVTSYGFKFGYVQDVDEIRGIARRYGFVEAFEEGYML